MLVSALEPEEARARLEADLADATATIAELRALADAADAGTHPRGRLRYGRLALEHGVYQAQATQAWARWALAELEARPDDDQAAG